jgi:hypothetical protein
MSTELIARLTGLNEPLVRAFFEGYDDADLAR